jgi:hypothetical protein
MVPWGFIGGLGGVFLVGKDAWFGEELTFQQDTGDTREGHLE